MNRALTLATFLAGALALPALADDKKIILDPPETAPTTIIADQVPQTKRDADVTKESGSQPVKPLPAANANSEAAPSVRAVDAVPEQPDTKSSPGETTAEKSAQHSAGMSLSEQESKTWVDKPVYSSDGKNVGEVVAFQRDADNRVIGLFADIGGLFGFGETRINVAPAQFKLQGDRVVLELTAAQAKELPKVKS